MNRDGQIGAGITIPSTELQETLMRLVYSSSRLNVGKSMGHCRYFEAHCIEALVGDPIEAAVIAGIFYTPVTKSMRLQGQFVLNSFQQYMAHRVHSWTDWSPPHSLSSTRLFH